VGISTAFAFHRFVIAERRHMFRDERQTHLLQQVAALEALAVRNSTLASSNWTPWKTLLRLHADWTQMLNRLPQSANLVPANICEEWVNRYDIYM
jgi:hypothetical protein